METEYYDTFDANKICTKRLEIKLKFNFTLSNHFTSNTSYLPVDLKTTTVSPSVHIKRTNKRIRSYFNEELTNWEYTLALLATLTVLITVTTISLALISKNCCVIICKHCYLIVFKPMQPKTSNHVNVNVIVNTSSLIQISCDCPCKLALILNVIFINI